MSEESTNSDSSQSANGEGAPLAGQRLADARRANDISIAEIAKALHLDEPKVQALEENQYEALGAPVFAKGHLRKYAELVGVPIDDILADYYQLQRSAGAPPVVGPKRKQPKDIDLGPWIGVFVVVAILGGAGAWWFTRDPAPDASESSPGELAPFAAQPAAEDAPAEQSDELPAEPEQELPAEVESEVAEQVAEEEPAEPAAPADDIADEAPADVAAAGQITVTMTFSGDCWTEVTDADGERLFFGLGQAGQVVTRSGVPPLQALFGDRNNVQVSVEGSDFPLTGGGRRGNTARVTLDSPQD